MKKLLLIFVIVFLNLTSVCFSQSGWQWFNPYPTGQRIRSMSFINSNTGMAVTDYGGSILWTTNGGINWVTFKPFNNSYFGCLLLDNNTGFAGEVSDYNPVKIIRTTNMGKDWEVIFNTGLTGGIEMFENKGDNIFALCDNKFIKSTNRGNSWTIKSIGTTVIYLNSLKFINENTGYICWWSKFYSEDNRLRQ